MSRSLILSVFCRKGGYVVAVVRGASDEVAFSRLRAGYDSGAPELLETFDALAKKHLRVYAGQQRPTHACSLYSPCTFQGYQQPSARTEFVHGTAWPDQRNAR